MSRIFVLVAGTLLGLAGGTLAQSAPPPVQQTGQLLDAGTAVAVSANYNTVNQQGVATVTPPAGQYVYITRIELEAINDGTGTAVVVVNFTSTGLGSGATASPQWGLSTADANIFRDINFSTPLKSAIAGQNVTITSLSTELHTGFGIKFTTICRSRGCRPSRGRWITTGLTIEEPRPIHRLVRRCLPPCCLFSTRSVEQGGWSHASP